MALCRRGTLGSVLSVPSGGCLASRDGSPLFPETGPDALDATSIPSDTIKARVRKHYTIDVSILRADSLDQDSG
jgi:hypothetical protein